MKNLLFNMILIVLVSCTSQSTNAQNKTNPNNQDEELGNVSWYRDYDAALKLATEKNKAVLILFQEIPGCSTCRNYGHQVLTHPLMVEGIENLFVPLVIHNNKGGKDKEILQKYGEPAWNNPVVRIVDKNGKDIVKRISGDYSTMGLYNGMITALKIQNKEIPKYFQLYGEEIKASNNENVKEKTYQMYCFWTGEKVLGDKEGVLEANAGFANGSEVVKVKYDINKISENELDQYATSANCKSVSAANYSFAKKDHLYYLQHSDYRYIPLSNLQKTKINSALGNNTDAIQFLSPKQLKWLKSIDNSTNEKALLYVMNINDAWKIKK